MSREDTLALARLVSPRALCAYAEELGWPRVLHRLNDVAIFHRPDSLPHQVLVPLDEGFTDYGEMVTTAVERLAQYENQPVREVFEQLLLPSADLLHFCDDGPHARDGSLPLNQGVDLIAGVRRALLAQAHSVLQALPSHPDLGRADAEHFVGACRLGQTRRGSYTVVIACPLDAVASLPKPGEQEPTFTRRVTAALMENLMSLVAAAEKERGADLLDRGKHPLLSANLYEAIVQMRPPGERPALTVSARWSRSAPPPDSALFTEVRLEQVAFALAEHLAHRLRSAHTSEPSWYVGFVEGLNGRPGFDGPSAGEIHVALMQGDVVLHARLELAADEYALASIAHLNNIPVYFRGVLCRFSDLHRVEQVGPFLLVQRPSLAQQAS